MSIIRKLLHFSAILCFAVVPGAFATQTNYTFYPVGDTFLKGEGHTSENEGLLSHMRIQHPPRWSHVVVKFSQDELISTIGTNQVVSARLELYIETNYDNWGSGAMVDVHRMEALWEEYIPGIPAQGATWDCAIDTNLESSDPDCEDMWLGGYYEDYITDSVFHQNGETGWKSFDVTGDVQLIQNGITHYGWLLRKRNDTDNGSVDYTSIQGAAANKPRLVVVVDDQTTPSASLIDSITPAIVPSDGTAQEVTINGEGLDQTTEIQIDDSPVSFTIVDPTTITFTTSQSSVGTHEISLYSNNIEEPVSKYLFEADSELYAVEGTSGCPSPGAVTNFSRVKNATNPNRGRLCWKGRPTRLIGYSGDFSLPTWNHKWTTSGGDQVSSDIQNYMARAQYIADTGNASRGTNLIRVVAPGGSCHWSAGPENCKGYEDFGDGAGHKPETMPFNWNSAQTLYLLKNLSQDGSGLKSNWKKRLVNLIKYADQNGIAVMISLFDQNLLKDGDNCTNCWTNNVWNTRRNSDLACIDDESEPPDAGNALPQFYKICSNYSTVADCESTLNCFGKAQRSYVKSVVQTVKNLRNCVSAGTSKCKNVIFEVMNEAMFDERWSQSELTLGEFRAWHNQVASWIKSKGAYMVAASVKSHPANVPCGGTDDYDDCRLAACGTTSCPNYFNVHFAPNLDVVSLHYGTWHNDICGMDNHALKFKKPVIFDDDGQNPERDQNNNVERWAQNVSYGVGQSCGWQKGYLHFYHTGDGTTLEGSAPSVCDPRDNGMVDCQTWNGIADGLPSYYCGTSCPVPRVSYCENYQGPQGPGCPQDTQ